MTLSSRIVQFFRAVTVLRPNILLRLSLENCMQVTSQTKISSDGVNTRRKCCSSCCGDGCSSYSSERSLLQRFNHHLNDYSPVQQLHSVVTVLINFFIYSKCSKYPISLHYSPILFLKLKVSVDRTRDKLLSHTFWFRNCFGFGLSKTVCGRLSWLNCRLSSAR